MKLPVLVSLLSAPFVALFAVMLVVANMNAPALTLAVERSQYPVGDTIRFAFHNDRSDDVFLSCTAPWRILRDVGSSWKPVESHWCGAMIVRVPAGDSIAWSWVAVNQPDDPTLVPVEPGRYRIDLPVMFACDPAVGACATFGASAFFELV